MPVGPYTGNWGCPWGRGWVPPHRLAGYGNPGPDLDFIGISHLAAGQAGLCHKGSAGHVGACKRWTDWSPKGADPWGCLVGHPYQLSPPCSKGLGQFPERPLLSLPERKGAQLGQRGPDPTLLPLDSLLLLFWGLFCKLNTKQLLLCLDCVHLGRTCDRDPSVSQV